MPNFSLNMYNCIEYPGRQMVHAHMILCKDNITKLTMPEKEKRGRGKEKRAQDELEDLKSNKEKAMPTKNG